jgi:diaminopimelate decarboxylase
MRYRAGGLALDGVGLAFIADRFGTPVYVTSELRIRENVRRVFRAFRREWPQFGVRYAVKANGNPALLRILADEGCGADCSSPGELAMAQRAGIPPERILYTPAYPSREELEAALRAGVALNLDHPGLLPYVVHESPRGISFRLNPGIRRSGPERLTIGDRGGKFGTPLRAALPAYREAVRAGVARIGGHSMVGSNLLDPDAFLRNAEFLGRASEAVRRETGRGLDFLDLGGGLGVPSRPGDRPLDLARVARGVSRSLTRELSPPRERNPLAPPELLVEPGRYLVADTTVLLTRVTDVKNGSPLWVGVDAGMQTLLRPALYGAYHPVFPVQSRRTRPTRLHVVGPVCEPRDVLARDRYLPAPRPGDLLAIGNAGAYGFAMSSQYTGRPRPAEVLVHRGQAYVIREAEDLARLEQGTRIPEFLRT